MKTLKLFGLAALLAMAFVGAGSAMAETTVLCRADEEGCQEGNVVTHVHESTLSGHKAVLLSSVLEVECDVLFLGDTLGESGAPLIIHGTFTYTNCSNSCTPTEENGPTELKVLANGSELSTVTSGTGAGAGLVHLTCFGFINCRYVGSGLSAHGLGALTSEELNGSVTLSEQTVSRESGSLCPSTSKLDITTTPLAKTYINQAGGIAQWKMVCIDVGAGNGLRLNVAGNRAECTNNDTPNYSGKYELGYALTTTVGTHVCAWVGNNLGRYLGTNNAMTACVGSVSPSRTGSYELGVVQ